MSVDFEPGHGLPVGPRRIARRLGGAADPVFSLCTMLTDWAEYRECMASFAARGFVAERCEFIVVDNSVANQADAYVACNEFLQAAVGRYVVLCHQDVLLLEHGFDALLAQLEAVEAIDPYWAVCGNAGYTADGWPVLNLEQDYGPEVQRGRLPMRVMSVDENFMVARRLANLALSRDLHGYHHYGPDLCTVADVLGWNSYVIDFYLKHKSTGTIDSRYTDSRDRIGAKYRRAFRSRWMHVVTQYPFLLSGVPVPARAARLQRWLGRAVGLYPRGKYLMDPERRARRYAAEERGGHADRG